LLISSREDDGVVHRRGLLQRNVEPKRVIKARDEQLYLLWLCDRWVMAREHHEPLSELVYQPRATKHGKFTKRRVRQQWPKVCIDQLYKFLPGRSAAIELHMVEPELGIVEEVAGHQRGTFHFRCSPNMEISLASVKPGQRISSAVVLQKF
jgi:hypothetical protein